MEGRSITYHLKGSGNILNCRALGRVDASAERKKVLSFVLITTDASAMVWEIHDGGGNPFRMPKILTHDYEKRWLDLSVVTGEAVAALLTVYPEKEMTAWPVGPKSDF